MDCAVSGGLPVRTAKRKAPNAKIPPAKRTRRNLSPVDEGSGSSEYSEGDGDQEEESSNEELVSSTAPTPLSLVSSRQSSQYPSRLKTIPCPYPECGKLFNRPARLSAHVRSHTNTRPFVCPHPPCTKDFLRDTHLAHHVKSAHSDVRDYVCPRGGCGKGFATGTRLKRHIAAHDAKEPYTCKEAGCGLPFRKHATMQAHVASVHEGKKPYACVEKNEDGIPCGASFDTSSKLKTHTGRVHGSAKYWCTLCSADQDNPREQADQGTAFQTYAAYKTHNKAVHRTCNDCGYTTTFPYQLTLHFECQHGGQDLSDRLTHHCPESDCGRSFTRNGNLLAHLKAAHGQGKPFVCGAIELSDLNNIASWLGDDPCGRGFTSKATLEQHVRTAHMGLEHSRKVKTNPKPRKARGVSALRRLTGVAQDEEADLTISCLRLDCSLRFSREYDLEMHLQSGHGLADFEIQYLRSERNGHGPSSYGYSLASERSAQDIEAEMAFDDGFRSTGLDGRMDDTSLATALDEAVAEGGKFWIGESTFAEGSGDDWNAHEKGMRRLIDEDDDLGNDLQDETVIDPALP